MQEYRTILALAAIVASPGEPIDMTTFRKSMKDNVPNLAQLALRYCNAVMNSADAERSFSLYNLVLSDRRKPLTEKTLKVLAFLYYN